jgi:Subtilase family
MCTSRPYRSDVVLAPASLAAQPREIERLNAILDDAGLGRPLGPAKSSTSELATLSVSADPLVVSETLLRAGRERGIQMPELVADVQHRAGTLDHNPRTMEFFFGAAGKKTGHGICWETAWKALDPPTTHRIDQRPVVALLDTGVEDHPFLRPAKFEDGAPLVVKAEDHGFELRVSIDDPNPTVGSHHGHGTFVAGLVHQAAPDAQLLSVKVMNDDGKVSEENVVKALQWLASSGLRVDVVLMAFGGRREDAGPTHEQKLRDAIAGFGDREVKFVASAGNDHCNCPTLPAVLAADPVSLVADPSSPVVSVGADSERHLSCYSNFGSWVKEWEDGTRQLSIMPLTPEPKEQATGWARWSGTSFSAANYAGKLARKILDDAANRQPVG